MRLTHEERAYVHAVVCCIRCVHLSASTVVFFESVDMIVICQLTS